MNWATGEISGCRILPVKTYADGRGWLAELFRSDEIDEELRPAMGYISETHPGVMRGPHEHVDQTDYFVFLQGMVSLFLWDDRKDSETYGFRTRVHVGAANPSIVVVPPGVVHAYRNDGDEPALILNFPNRLYAGPDRSEPVDEIRHEDLSESRFAVD